MKHLSRETLSQLSDKSLSLSSFHPIKSGNCPASLRFANRMRCLEGILNKLAQLESWPQVDKWLAKELQVHKKMGSRDRRWYAHGVFSSLRHGLWIGVVCKAFQENVSPQSSTTLELDNFINGLSLWYENSFRHPKGFFYNFPISLFLKFLFQHHNWDESYSCPKEGFLQTWNEWASRHPNFTLKCIRAGVPPVFSSSLKLRIQHSKWTDCHLQKFLDNLSTQPPLWVRWNSLDWDPASPLMAGASCLERLGTHAPQAMAIQYSQSLYEWPPYQSGLVEIQDGASQAIGHHVPLKKGDIIWDCCAGGGGKSLQLASRLSNSGAVYASDIRTYKLAEVRKRARRCGFFNIRTLEWDGVQLPPLPKEVKKRGGFDSILVDAPCSASGTWRRNPDAKFRISSKDLQELKNIQINIISNVKNSLRLGGYLVYGTCSWFPDENEEVIDAVLQLHPDLILVDKNLHGSPHWNSDTMFSACFQKMS